LVGVALISSITINGFRGIKNCELKDLSEINVFMGRNNSGKSSILEALYLASAAFKYEEPLGRDVDKVTYLLNRRCHRNFSWSRGKETLWYEYDVKNPIRVEIRLGRGQTPMILLIGQHEHPIIATRWGKGQAVLEKLHPSFFSQGVCLRDSMAFGHHVSISIGTDVMSRVFAAEFRNFNEVKSFMEKMMFVDANLIHMMDKLEKVLWSELLKQRLDKLVANVLKQGYEMDVEDLTYVPYGDVYQLAVKLPKTTIRADDLGDGARFSIVLIMIASLLKNTALLVEEPENHQHPGGLAKSLEMLLTLTKTNKVQIFASTHSNEFVKLLEKIAEEKNMDVTVFFLERDAAGKVDVRRITSEDARILEKMGLDIRFVDMI
jgi:predicted ATP-dependent endonuclease of OLD family